MKSLKCCRCGNTDPRKFGKDHGMTYCRKCLEFGRLDAGVLPKQPQLSSRIWKGSPVLKFDLTPAQKQVSDQALGYLKQKKDVFVYAAAGAGKTEISFASICFYLAQGKKVCFAISRRQVVLEIAKRLKEAFPDLSVIAVCEGHTRKLDGDLIVCTTHQLFRYPGCFDLLIMDEVDAFPFAGNEVLNHIAQNACRGQRMLLSATPDEHVQKAVESGKMAEVHLFSRPHGKPLCVPKIVRTSKVWSLVLIWKQCLLFHQQNKQVLVFVPRIKDGIWMHRFLGCFWKTGLISSKTLDKDSVMDAFYAKETEILVCTTLLERGITVPSVQVLVYRADHPVFSQASLIQIFGRVGRSFQDPTGTGICFCEDLSGGLKGCVRQLEWMNRSLCAPSA